jgi:hypothetical protein
MKVRLETAPIQNKGIALISENLEEAQRLLDIWNGHGGVAALSNDHAGIIELVIAPQPEKEEKKK